MVSNSVLLGPLVSPYKDKERWLGIFSVCKSKEAYAGRQGDGFGCAGEMGACVASSHECVRVQEPESAALASLGGYRRPSGL